MNRRRTQSTTSSVGAVQAGVLAAVVTVVPSALWTTADPVGIVKWTLLIVAAISLIGLLVVSHTRTGQTTVSERQGLVPVALFLVAVLVMAGTSESRWLAVLGEYTYYQGALTFLALGVILVTVLAVPKDPTEILLRATTLGAGLVGLLTAGQFVGIAWFGYEPRMFGRVVTTLGNSNFGAAFLALTLPAVLHQVFFGSRSAVERWLSAGVGIVIAVEAVVIGSVQGPITAVVAVVAWSALVGLRKVGMRRTALGLVGLALVAAVLVLASWSRLYTEVADSVQVGRQGAWLSGWAQFEEHPFLGVGLDHFGENYTAYRPPFSAARESERFTDAGQAHNVVLDLLADGGLLLGGTYVALVLYTAYRAVRGLRRFYLDGPEAGFLQLAAVFAAWLAYQAQALVSIDHVPLAMIHWVFMGLIFRLSHTAEGTESLVLGQRRRRTKPPTAALAGIGVACLALVWLALIPFRADLAAGATERLEKAGRPEEAVQKLEHATSLMPFRPFYWIQLGLRLQQLEGAGAAAPFIERGAELDRSNSRIAMLMAQYYTAADDPESARAWYEEAIDRDPHNPEILQAAAGYFVQTGDEERAQAIRDLLTELPPPPEG